MDIRTALHEHAQLVAGRLEAMAAQLRKDDRSAPQELHVQGARLVAENLRTIADQTDTMTDLLLEVGCAGFTKV